MAAPSDILTESATCGSALSTVEHEILTGLVVANGYGYPGIPTQTRYPSPVIPDRAEELANTITHGLGLVLSVAGLYSLINISRDARSLEQAVACVIYGASLVLLYASSTLYHGAQDAGVKRIFLLLDHIGICVLIAGTYTPLALIALRGTSGWVLLLLVWGFALVG